jgi:DNA-binding protein H-NS
VAAVTENPPSGEDELLSAMEELARVQQRVDQLREQNREKAIAEITEKIRMYDLKPEELGFPKIPASSKARRKSGLERAIPQGAPAPGSALSLETASGDRRSQVKPKYVSPDGQSTWSGRGKPPLWMKVLLDAGAKKEDFEVDKSNA